jgi:hypothetical protein
MVCWSGLLGFIHCFFSLSLLTFVILCRRMPVGQKRRAKITFRLPKRAPAMGAAAPAPEAALLQADPAEDFSDVSEVEDAGADVSDDVVSVEELPKQSASASIAASAGEAASEAASHDRALPAAVSSQTIVSERQFAPSSMIHTEDAADMDAPPSPSLSPLACSPVIRLSQTDLDSMPSTPRLDVTAAKSKVLLGRARKVRDVMSFLRVPS